MPRRTKHKPEEIVAKLGQVEVAAARGTPIPDAIRPIAATAAPSSRIARSATARPSLG
jgi:hypothetical protein